MNDVDPDRHGGEATRQLLTVEEACRRFAQGLVEGRHPDIESLVEVVAPANRETLRERLEALSTLLSASGTPSESAPPAPATRPLDGDATIQVPPAAAEATRPPASTPDETIPRRADPTAGRTAPGHPEAPVSAPRTEHEKAPLAIPGYRFEKVLGRGGMGVVYQAVDETLGRRVALKMVLDPGAASEEALRRFKLEAQAVAELKDPRFVQIYEYGTHRGTPFMVLELVEGGSLEDFRRKEPQPERLAAELTRDLASAMHVAHEAGIVHRDLKPQNVLLTNKLEPKIADFGLVKRIDQDASQMTQHGSVMGTASYMAPEQSRGETDIGPPADIHALGGILYCLLTGRPPFLGSNVYDTIQQVRTEEPVPPSRLRPKLSKDLETICLKCLQKSPEKRYISARELAEDLERFLDGRPILARPVSLPERVWRWTRRNPLAATIAALVVAIAIGGTAASWRLTLLNRRLTIEKQNTEKARALAVRRRREAEAARAEEVRQRAAADAAREAKSRQYNEVLLAYHSVLDRVERRLRNDPRQVELRKEIIDLAMKSLGKVRDASESNVLADRNQAVGYQRLGGIYEVVGQLEEARKQYGLAAAILRRILRQHPRDPQHLRNVAAIDNRLASVLDRLGRRREARSLYAASLDLRIEWDAIRTRQNHPNHLDAKRAVAQSYVNLGSIDLELGDPQRALAQFESARQWYRKLPKEILLRPAVFRELTLLEHFLGETYSRLGNLPEAERMLVRVTQKRQKLMEHDESDPAKLAYCRSRLILGDFYFIHRRDLGKAWKHYRPVWRLAQELYQANPFSRDTKWNLANIAYRMGVTVSEAEAGHVALDPTPDPSEASSYFERSCRLREELARIDEDDMQARIEWALALARVGRQKEAEKQAEILLEHGQDDPRLLFQAACTLALIAEGDARVAARRRDRAFAILRQLADAGWKDRISLERDPDLAPLRRDARYDELLKSFAKTDG